MSHPVSWLYTVDEEGGTCEIISGERLMANLSSQAACGIFHVEQRDCEWTNGVLPFALDPCSVDVDGEHTWAEQTFDGPTWVLRGAGATARSFVFARKTSSWFSLMSTES